MFFSQISHCNQHLPQIIRRPNQQRAGAKRLHKRVDGDHRIREQVRHRAEADPRGTIIGENGADRHRADGDYVNEDGNDETAF